MITTILIVLAGLLVVFVVMASQQPDDFRIVRTATISAPAAVVFAHVNDLHLWQEWSPWAKRDPAAQRTFEGPSAGTGAVFAWAGNRKIGAGRMTITASRPHDLVGFRLEFLKPFTATNTAEFTFQPEGSQTLVTWSMAGKSNFLSKAFGLVMNMDNMIGRDFEKGLANLKALAEAAAR